MADDFQLLREYVERGSDDAFRELVERHARLVYGTTRRVLDNETLAEEATQATFILLARKAAGLRPGTIVAGWLFRTARFVALESRRQEQRRRQHQDNFMELNGPPELVWEKIAPLVDEAMSSLGAGERDAVVLRFFEDRSFAEVAGALGTTEAAAKMRVGRALEKLRHSFLRQGMAVSAVVLSAAFTAHGAGSLPVGLTVAVSSAALASGTAGSTSITALVKGALLIMAWNKTRNAIVAVVILLLLAGGTVVTFKQIHHTKHRAPIVATFEPMAGEWEGTFVMSGNGMAEPFKQNAALSIRTIQDGRGCEIEMRVLRPDGKVGRIYHFTHAIAGGGNQIVTQDDPSVARVAGAGMVTASEHNERTGVWRAAFRAELPDGKGSTDCEWIRIGDELTIVRHDRDGNEGEGTSEMRLRKTSFNRPVL
jgi:RNA polymerase sigma factor (sigma-70 family)